MNSELDNQLGLLKKVRQRVLQDAIEGKVTTNWRAANPVVEPASLLLKHIADQKDNLNKRKKVNRKKIVPPVTDEEKPFDLPSGWAWCRIGDIGETKVGATPSKDNPDYWNGNVNWVSSGEVANNRISVTANKITKKGVDETSAKTNPKGSVLVAMIGQGKTRGQVAILDIEAATNQNVCAIRLYDQISPEFVYYFFLSRYEKTRSGASGGNQPALNGIKISNTVLGLPPHKEAQEIVERIQGIEPILSDIERQVAKNRSYTELLMQAALYEAFAAKPVGEQRIGTEPQDNLVTFNSKHLGYYKRVLLAAEIVDQLHTEPTLGHLKLQKLIYLC